MPENYTFEILKAVLIRAQAFPQLRSRYPDRDAVKDRPVRPTLHSIGFLGPRRKENALLRRAVWCAREGADAELTSGAAAIASDAVG
jgi:hypothetical protein